MRKLSKKINIGAVKKGKIWDASKTFLFYLKLKK